jgi:hypothetical protein
MSLVSKSGDLAESKARRNDYPMVIDMIANESDRRRISGITGFVHPDERVCKETTVYYLENIKEYGFDHIIIIGEDTDGIVFLDCYGRVFLWDDATCVLWPLGNSLDEMMSKTPKNSDNPRGDRVVWIADDNVVYERPLGMYALLTKAKNMSN